MLLCPSELPTGHRVWWLMSQKSITLYHMWLNTIVLEYQYIAPELIRLKLSSNVSFLCNPMKSSQLYDRILMADMSFPVTAKYLLKQSLCRFPVGMLGFVVVLRHSRHSQLSLHCSLHISHFHVFGNSSL